MAITKNNSQRWIAFAQEYHACGNATAAAIAVGYAPGSAKVRGHLLLDNPTVAAEVARLAKLREKKTGIDAAWVLKEAVDTYKSARDANKHAAAVSALTLVAKHVDVGAVREHGELTDAVKELISGLTKV